jgi:protein involved in polysaccharide export with SLBB domain
MTSRNANRTGGVFAAAAAVFILSTAEEATCAKGAPNPAHFALTAADDDGGNKKVDEKSRVIRSGDRLAVSIDDLEAINQKMVVKVDVDAKGNVTLPSLKQPVPAAGMTLDKLEAGIVKAYHDAQLLNKANVKVVFRGEEGRKPQAS